MVKGQVGTGQRCRGIACNAPTETQDYSLNAFYLNDSRGRSKGPSGLNIFFTTYPFPTI